MTDKKNLANGQTDKTANDREIVAQYLNGIQFPKIDRSILMPESLKLVEAFEKKINNAVAAAAKANKLPF